MKPLVTYFRLQFAEAVAELHVSEARQLASFVKYAIIGLLCARGLWLLITPSVAFTIPAWKRLIEGGSFLALMFGTATFSAAVGMHLFRRLPELPFQRFWSRRTWFLWSWFLPLVSLNTLWISLLFVGIVGLRGLGYFLIFYGAQILAQRALPLALSLAAATAAGSYLGATELGVAAVAVSGLLGGALGVWHTVKPGVDQDVARPSFAWRLLTIELRKELAYHRTYTSDTVHLVLAILVWAFGALMLSKRPDRLTDSFGLPFICMMAVLPFSRVLLNFMGMDSVAIRRLVYDPSLLVRYQLSRMRGYALAIYGLDAVVAVLLAVTGNAVIVPRLLLTAIVCTECSLFIGFYLSVYLFEEKEVAYRYGQNLQSRNIHVSLALLVAVGAVVHALYSVGGVISLAIAAVGSLYLDTRWIQRVGVEVVESRRDHLIHTVG